jgi:hypothetical protein
LHVLVVGLQLSGSNVLVIRQDIHQPGIVGRVDQSHDLVGRLARRVQTIHELIYDDHLLSTGEYIGHQRRSHEQQDEPKTECEFVGNLQVGKPMQHRLSPDT